MQYLMDGNCHILADSHWVMCLKAVGQLLGTAKRVSKSCWEMPKSYWKASGQLGKNIGMPLRNTSWRPIGEEAELPSGFWQKFCQFLFISSEVVHLLFK
jgi:hypothetical protein